MRKIIRHQHGLTLSPMGAVFSGLWPIVKRSECTCTSFHQPHFKMTAYNRFFQRLQCSLIKNSRTLNNSLQCIEWTGATDRHGYGRKRVTWPNGQMTMTGVHRVAYMTDKRLTPNDISSHDDDGHVLEVSHICHHKKCINKDHLVLEGHDLNMARKQCCRLGACTLAHIPHCLFD